MGPLPYYVSDDMRAETIGGAGAYLNNRVLFYQGNVLVDAVFDRMSVMSAAQLRELAGLLPQAEGNKGNPPSLPTYLPKRAFQRNFDKNTTKYILGPVALESSRIAAAGFDGGFQVGRGSRHRQVCGGCGRRHADADRISDAADCRGTTAADRCLAPGHASSNRELRRLSMSVRSSTRAPVRSS